jgi:hypothetical protein
MYDRIKMKLTDRLWDYFLQNPVAWFFQNPVAWLLVALLYYKLNRQLDTVCDAIKLPDEFIDRLIDGPKNAYARAQNICGDRHERPIAS